MTCSCGTGTRCEYHRRKRVEQQREYRARKAERLPRPSSAAIEIPKRSGFRFSEDKAYRVVRPFAATIPDDNFAALNRACPWLAPTKEGE